MTEKHFAELIRLYWFEEARREHAKCARFAEESERWASGLFGHSNAVHNERLQRRMRRTAAIEHVKRLREHREAQLRAVEEAAARRALQLAEEGATGAAGEAYMLVEDHMPARNWVSIAPIHGATKRRLVTVLSAYDAAGLSEPSLARLRALAATSLLLRYKGIGPRRLEELREALAVEPPPWSRRRIASTAAPVYAPYASAYDREGGA